MPALDRVVAARQQRLVGARGGARAVAIELGLPEVAEVGLVPDVDRPDLRVAIKERGDEAAVGGALGSRVRGSARGAEYVQEDLLGAGVQDCGLQRRGVRGARLGLPRLPALGHAVVAEPKVVRDRRDSLPRLDGVVVDAEGDIPSGGRGRRHGEREDESEALQVTGGVPREARDRALLRAADIGAERVEPAYTSVDPCPQPFKLAWACWTECAERPSHRPRYDLPRANGST